jgi:hypothetical protein
MDNPSYITMFYHECQRYADELGQDRMNQLRDAVGGTSLGSVEESQNETSDTFTPHSTYDPISFPADGLDFFSTLEAFLT